MSSAFKMNGHHNTPASNGVHIEHCQKNNSNESAKKMVKLLNGIGLKNRSDAKQYVPDMVRDPAELQMLTKYAIDYAHCIGLEAPVPSDPPEANFSNVLAMCPPITLFPSPFPRELYEQAVDVQQSMNELYFRIASDHDFLMDAFKDVVKGDPFMARFVHIAKQIHEEGVRQPLAIALQRADYLAHWDPQNGQVALKQVEVNIGPVGGPGFGSGVSKLHRKMLAKLTIEKGGTPVVLAKADAPENRASQNLSCALYQAWKLFGDPSAILLFLDSPNITHFEQLQFIQFGVEKLGMQDGKLVSVMSMTMVEAAKRLSLDEAGDFSLYLDGDKRIALVHIADGNMPDEYPSEREWQARIMMERSTAILSPNIRFQLSSTKKIQQVLAKPGMLDRFFPKEPQRVAQIRNTFAGLWGLDEDDEPTRTVIQNAIRCPQDFVLKSQLEAGLGNFFDAQMAEMLRTMNGEQRSAYILQQRIKPLVVKNFLLRRPSEPAELESVVGELGIYGTLIGDQRSGRILHNSVDGHTIRSKPSDLNQGGIGSGGGSVDSALLFSATDLMNNDDREEGQEMVMINGK